ncbi:putative elongator complex protein 1 isoform X2 [Hydra vulgaris]|uniref:Elongator complex protein 1 n=1 Tax=Hydra vulgaris TaxID=6087 RepID=A0ABM4D9R7_HYDVU
MRNLVLLDSVHYNVGVIGSHKLTYDSLNEVVYFATVASVFGFSPKEKQTLYCISLKEGGYIEEDYQKIVSIYYMCDKAELCIITTKGDCLIWKAATGEIELMGSIESGISSSAWSPDNELLVITTGSGSFLLMSCDFDVICEQAIHSAAFGEAQQITVGWGKKETQFHGSEGKEAAHQKLHQESKINLWDDYRTEVSWRGDGQFFAISSVDQVRSYRCVRIYNREGILQSTSEKIEGLEECIAWRPSGNLIACSQRKPNKHDVIFLEKNGLQHGQFTLPFLTHDKMILCISWNVSSDVLMLLLTDMKKTTNYVVQLWTVGNYHWYLKQEINFKNQNKSPTVVWDQDCAYKIHIICDDGSYYQNIYMHVVNQSSGQDNNSMVAVADGKKLLLTPFKLQTVPPPMAALTITLSNTSNIIAFGVESNKHDLLIQTSDKQFVYLLYDGQYKMIPVLTDNKITELNLRQFVWFHELYVSAIEDNQSGNSIILMELSINDDNIKLTLKDQIFVSNKVLVLFKSNFSNLYIENEKGGIYELIFDGFLKLEKNVCCSLPLPCSNIACLKFEDKTMVFGLTNQYRLFLNEKEIATNCTSFFVHDEFLLLTTHTHSLRCISLSSLFKVITVNDSLFLDEASRRIERGSRLITVIAQGTLAILQMPRGNLECIHPRALVICHLKKLLSNLEYAEAMNIMRKHRINLNLFYDHNPELFTSHIGKFISEMESVNFINLFLADLMTEDVCKTMYSPFYYGMNKPIDSQTPSNKVDLICKQFQKIIEQKITKNNNELLLALLTTYARQNDLEYVLLKIKDLKENPSADGVTCNAALVYILYLVDINSLFDIALGLYDFDLVMLVAEKSQKDPKEYIPFLNNFKKMDEFYMKYSIDKYLKRYHKALISLSKCENCFDELTTFVKEHRLYKQALQLFETSSLKYKKISLDYASYLVQQKLYEDAAIVYSRCGFRKQALEQYTKTKNWNMVLTEARLLEYSPQSLMTLYKNLSERLKNEHMYKEAADILEHYVKDIEESAMCLLKGGLWFHAIHLMHKYEREDLIETNLKPSIHECCEITETKIKDLETRFIKHTNRLKVVVKKKEKDKLEILQGPEFETENSDIYSDTSSVTGQTSSVKSRGSQSSSGHSSKSRKKVNRKKYSLKEGSVHEEFALREALAEIITTTDKMKEEISDLLKVMCLYYFDDKAKTIQNEFESLINIIELNIKEIWTENMKNSDDNVCKFGPSSTVHSIIQLSMHQNNTKESNTPISVQPTMRPNIQWKVHMLRV